MSSGPLRLPNRTRHVTSRRWLHLTAPNTGVLVRSTGATLSGRSETSGVSSQPVAGRETRSEARLLAYRAAFDIVSERPQHPSQLPQRFSAPLGAPSLDLKAAAAHQALRHLHQQMYRLRQSVWACWDPSRRRLATSFLRTPVVPARLPYTALSYLESSRALGELLSETDKQSLAIARIQMAHRLRGIVEELKTR